MKKNLLLLVKALKQRKINQIFRTMKFAFLFLFLLIVQTQAGTVMSQNAQVVLKTGQTTLKEVMAQVERQTGYLFVYSDSEVNVNKKVNIKKSKQEVADLLNNLKETGITYTFSDNYISLHKPEAQVPGGQQSGKTIKVSGKVTDPSGEAVIGANVTVKGNTTIGTITDIDGCFELSVDSRAVLLVSYIGYQVQEVKADSSKPLAIRLAEDSELLSEVVVTALGIKREEKALGYAVQKVGNEALTKVKPVNVASSLTGKVAGLNINNSTEFNDSPSLSLRGCSPLLIVDGVPYGNVGLNDIAADDIESIDVLKGATASALYGARGEGGAIMVTTKKAAIEGLNVTVNSSTMFTAGYLKRPEVQTSYSSGSNGTYGTGGYVWGDKLDIGRTAEQYDPYTQEWREMPLVSKGKHNLQNFQQLSLVTNNNISISQKGKYGSVRSSLTHVYNKGQYPNQKLNKVTYTVSGEMKWKKFSFDGGLTYNKRWYPNDMGAGYGGSGFLYNLLIWSGTEYDIRDYRNYWATKNEQQNWMDKTWYDNPYFIANEITRSRDYSLLNGYLSAKYDFTSWLQLFIRSGLDSYSTKNEWKNPISALGGWDKNGYYCLQRDGGYSLNEDIMLSANHKFGDFELDGLVGGSIYYWKSDNLTGETQNGLKIPGYYSLKASVDPVRTTSGITKKQVNSMYAKASLNWKSTVFVDVTGRNDWSSTLPSETRSYFYPSVAGSVVLSQFVPLPKAIDFWKVRGSWTVTKRDLGVYDTNNTYSISTDLWNGGSAAYYPTSIRGVAVKPSATRSYEIGSSMHFMQNRLRLDLTYYNKLYYNLTRSAGISNASGFSSTLINIDEEYVGKGWEIMISGDILRGKDWNWSSTLNWARDRWYYTKIDPLYSTQKPWVKAGARWDWYAVYDWERDSQGRIINYSGYAKQSDYNKVVGYEYPDWTLGWSNSISYKNFTLSFSIDGRVGGVGHSSTEQAMWNSGVHIDSDNQWRYDEVVNGLTNFVGEGVKIVSGSVDYDSNGNITRDDRVFAPNDVPVSYEAYMKNMNPYIGTVVRQNVYDKTFFKLRDLSLTYQLSETACSKVGLKGAALSFVGQNLLMWTKEFRFADPDAASDNLSSPSIRYVGFNVKLDF
ncbi:SusC/RagA family TonB-linked outer membrane protein [Phocaeicola sp.]|uniref:SusC/RagA family TonB-linked outer membrane protein n=1 Tax=Phocaeicola sp. TaxID=2773926 RepID=UPI0023BE3D24|nr:SusC/RagA family TonB-linked outer membrane protein [Phocaeicola sp.]MDE5678551.1 SusC/RagA family TonB-linked outer membrane protein [Phocaeicola sp.]